MHFLELVHLLDSKVIRALFNNYFVFPLQDGVAIFLDFLLPPVDGSTLSTVGIGTIELFLQRVYIMMEYVFRLYLFLLVFLQFLDLPIF